MWSQRAGSFARAALLLLLGAGRPAGAHHGCGDARLFDAISERLEQVAADAPSAPSLPATKSPEPPRPIRILPVLQLPESLGQASRDLLSRTVVPMAVSIASDSLQLAVPAPPRLKVPRRCSRRWPRDQGGGCRTFSGSPAADGGPARPTCWFADHDVSIFGTDLHCPEGPDACVELPEGPGLDASFVLYVTSEAAIGSEEYCRPGTIALGAPCEFEAGTFRPLAGNLNFCPGSVSPEDPWRAVDVAVHELVHALGFTRPMFGWFRGGVGATVVAAAGGAESVVAGAVVAAAREHFACDEIAGLPLEDDGGGGTAGSHWEVRLLGEELMTGSADGKRPLLSAMTLAMLGETGWYVPDLGRARVLGHGRRQGCSFALSGAAPPSPCGRVGQYACSPDRLTHGLCQERLLEPSTTAVSVFKRAGGACFSRYSGSALLGPANEPLRALVSYGPGARCLEEVSRGQRIPRCMSVACDAGVLFVSAAAGGAQPAPCPAGGRVTVRAGSGPPHELLCPRTQAEVDDVCAGLGCPHDCHGNGVCIEGRCQCWLGFAGEACGGLLPLPPGADIAPLSRLAQLEPGQATGGGEHPPPGPSPGAARGLTLRTLYYALGGALGGVCGALVVVAVARRLGSRRRAAAKAPELRSLPTAERPLAYQDSHHDRDLLHVPVEDPGGAGAAVGQGVRAPAAGAVARRVSVHSHGAATGPPSSLSVE